MTFFLHDCLQISHGKSKAMLFITILAHPQSSTWGGGGVEAPGTTVNLHYLDVTHGVTCLVISFLFLPLLSYSTQYHKKHFLTRRSNVFMHAKILQPCHCGTDKEATTATGLERALNFTNVYLRCSYLLLQCAFFNMLNKNFHVCTIPLQPVLSTTLQLKVLPSHISHAYRMTKPKMRLQQCLQNHTSLLLIECS